MTQSRQWIVSILILLIGLHTTVTSSADQPIRKFDEFGDVNCEDEMARLDNFVLQLQNSPHAKGAIIYYGGKTFRGKLPRRGDAAARAARLKPYLVRRRGLPADRVIIINGGYAEEWHAELWVVYAGMPTPDPARQFKPIKFRKGKAYPRDFRCQI